MFCPPELGLNDEHALSQQQSVEVLSLCNLFLYKRITDWQKQPMKLKLKNHSNLNEDP